MVNKIKILVKELFFYCLFFITLSVLNAQFKTYWPGKEVHVSLATGKFLKKMMPKFQIVFHEKNRSLRYEETSLSSYRHQILDILNCFSVTNSICGDDIEHLGQFIFKARAPLVITMKSKDLGKKSKINLSILGKEIGLELDNALKEVYIGTAKTDLEQIREFLRNPTYDQVIYIYGLIQEIIRHFDGVSITEYDFIVLCQCALFILLIVD